MNNFKRYFLEIAYDGSNYAGWQIQKNAIAVQQIINERISTVLNKPLQIHGASRTDTGVHAIQTYAHIDLEIDLPNNFANRINSFLPKDIVIKNIFLVDNEAHARFDAVERAYDYIICFYKNPFLNGQAYYYTFGNLDFVQMNIAASKLLNYKDFSSFCKAHSQVFTKNCKITYAKWHKEKDQMNNEIWKFNIVANRFLRGMVRGIVGTLIKVGKGEYSIDDFENIIKEKDISKTDFSAPPEGLFLKSIKYPFIAN